MPIARFPVSAESVTREVVRELDKRSVVDEGLRQEVKERVRKLIGLFARDSSMLELPLTFPIDMHAETMQEIANQAQGIVETNEAWWFELTGRLFLEALEAVYESAEVRQRAKNLGMRL